MSIGGKITESQFKFFKLSNLLTVAEVGHTKFIKFAACSIDYLFNPTHFLNAVFKQFT